MKRLVPLILLLVSGFAMAAESAAPREVEAGRDYQPITPAQPTQAGPGEVEVVEFFWYGCPHCFAAEEHVQAWLASRPEGVTFIRVPATINRGWALMAQAYYAAEMLGVLDVMHPALFAAFHVDKRPLDSADALAALFREKADVEESAFHEAFESLAVASRVQRADILARRHRIAGVPTMTVAGKFATDPEQAGGYAEMLEVVDALARQELAAQAE